MFWEMWQNSQENTCARVSFNKACNFFEKEICHRCFPVKFSKFLRTIFLQNTPQRLLLQCIKIWFRGQSFRKSNLLGKALKPPLFCSSFFWLNIFFQWKNKNNIDYSSSPPYLIDGNWFIGFTFLVKWLGRKSQL